uniref:Uncharacterized protein n=1 Tax=uncultured bacterium contig00117 TaxID=1181578 RepID=A0A806KGD4_9BACT|nr:hypothetical protein [uncultured bacterium contig00117]
MLPLNRLRKGVVFFAFLLLFFVFYRLLFFKTKADIVLLEDDTPSVTTEMCLLVTANGPMSVDTIFSLKDNVNKIFAYSFLGAGLNTADTVWHQWYYGSDLIKKIVCMPEKAACHSSLSADSLQEGDWSVDTRRNGILLNIRQFTIERF